MTFAKFLRTPFLQNTSNGCFWVSEFLIYLYLHFFSGNQQILPYQKIQTQILFWCIISYSFNFFWAFQDSFNKHGYNFSDVSKNGYSRSSYNTGILKGYDVIICVHDVTKEILSRDSNYIVGVAMWPKFDNSGTSMKGVIISSIL